MQDDDTETIEINLKKKNEENDSCYQSDVESQQTNYHQFFDCEPVVDCELFQNDDEDYACNDNFDNILNDSIDFNRRECNINYNLKVIQVQF